MQAAAAAQTRLLDVQAIDTAIAQLEHRRRTLPEHAEIAERQQRRRQAGEQLTAAETVVSDLELDVAKAESDLVPVRQRLERDQERVGSGAVTDPKQLSALLEEIEHLKRRIGDLEDVQLEVMERLETATAERDGLAAARVSGDDELRALLAARNDKVAEIDAELGKRTAERAAVVADLPAGLLELYERIRVKSGGVGAAALVQRRCSGCQLAANAADLVRYRAAGPDEVLRCEECNRILVRTAESGL